MTKSFDQTAEGLSKSIGISAIQKFELKDIEILQTLSKKVAELAAKPLEDEKRKLWYAHNDLQRTRPLVFCDPENGWNEIITSDQILCENSLAQNWEFYLRKEIFWAENMQDDRVIEPYFNIPYIYEDTGYGLSETKIGGEHGGAFVYDYPVKDYDSDFDKLKYPEIIINTAQTKSVLELAHEVFDGILQVRLKSVYWWTLGMTWDYIKLRGLENLMLDMILYPDYVHKMMDFLSKSVHKKLDFLETNGLLSLNTEGTYVGSGGFGWTNQLPKELPQNQFVKTMDMWGFCESQETVGISPEMFAEFIYPYQKPILERFGLNCYGCCEPLDKRWHIIKDIPRLRRVSVSPWADIDIMAKLLEHNYIFSLKPSPTPLAAPQIDLNQTRQGIKDMYAKTKDCCVEIIMKDNHTLGNNPMNAVNWCRIAKEEAMKMD